jgi:hypothetical protein
VASEDWLSELNDFETGNRHTELLDDGRNWSFSIDSTSNNEPNIGDSFTSRISVPSQINTVEQRFVEEFVFVIERMPTRVHTARSLSFAGVEHEKNNGSLDCARTI